MAGKLVKQDGKFVMGGKPGPGRPKGSKNAITLQKLLLEEAVRGDLRDDMAKVIHLIVMQAMEGDKASQKLVWDANMSKQAISEEKNAGAKQQITVKTMNVTQEQVIEGEFIDETESSDSPTKETIQ